MVADTSGLLALFNRREPAHKAVATFVGSAEETLAISPQCPGRARLPAGHAGGHRGRADRPARAGRGAFLLVSLAAEEVLQAGEVIERYPDLGIGVADASLVVLAARFGTRTVLTLDRRHFDVVRSLSGGRFKIVP